MSEKLVMERILKAPRERVWRACSTVEGLREWWGQPHGATMPVCELDFREGGVFRFKVEVPNGMVVWVKMVFREIRVGERIVLDDFYSNEAGEAIDSAELPASKITIELSDIGADTKLVATHEFERIGTHGIDEYKQGWSESFDRLEESLSTE